MQNLFSTKAAQPVTREGHIGTRVLSCLLQSGVFPQKMEWETCSLNVLIRHKEGINLIFFVYKEIHFSLWAPPPIVAENEESR